jgi:hypothetical protein
VTRDKDGKIEKTGKVRIQIDIYPKHLAEMNKVGEARQEPNCNPFLPPPIGRLSFSLNPLKMFVSILYLLYLLIATTRWTSFKKKDLLLLFFGFMFRYLHNVFAYDYESAHYIVAYVTILMRYFLFLNF